MIIKYKLLLIKLLIKFKVRILNNPKNSLLLKFNYLTNLPII